MFNSFRSNISTEINPNGCVGKENGFNFFFFKYEKEIEINFILSSILKFSLLFLWRALRAMILTIIPKF